LGLWHIGEAATSTYDDMEDEQVEDEPELLVKVAHRGDVTDLLVSHRLLCTFY